MIDKNIRIIKEYERYILVEITCPNNHTYRTTEDKWQPRDNRAILETEDIRPTNKNIRYRKRGKQYV